MATIADGVLTLMDFAKRVDPETNQASTKIAELLSQQNAILDDMLWKEGNLTTGHRTVMRTGLPESTWRKLNGGVAPTKSSTVQVDEACGMLHQRGQIDKDLAMLNGGTSSFRASENLAHMEAMAQDLAQTVFYGDHTVNPERFLGLAPRYSTISGATNGQNVLDAGGTGSDNTSIWLAGWGERSGHGIVPKGSKVGLQHTEIKDGSGDGCTDAEDANGYKFRAFVDEYQWKCGLSIADWRYFVRICNIDVSNLVAESSAADLIKFMSRSLDRLPSESDIKPVFYANRTVFSALRIQALNKSNSALSIEDALNQFGKSRKELQFQGVPVRKVDQLLNTEARIV